jgi:hypothetical protein
MRVLLLAALVDGRPGELRLVGPRAQLAWTPDVEARLRALVTELVAADAAPRIAGVANAFHVPGSLPGESETQIFLTTDSADPASLSILRRPGEAPRWAVSLGDIVDEAAAVPAPDTLLWYRLACGLPATLPDTATAALTPAEAAAARADYGVVLEGLGPCRRRRRGEPASERRQLDSDAGAIRIDVGLAGGHAQRRHPGARGDQRIDSVTSVSWRLKRRLCVRRPISVRRKS